MVVSGPSWNTDQGVEDLCECLGVKPTREMKVNVGESLWRIIDRSGCLLKDLSKSVILPTRKMVAKTGRVTRLG